jgi:Arc/MetJ-type ribon-helix-helix transcriptional regulator
MERKKENVIINLQIPKSLRDLLDELVMKDTHGTLSEYVRDSIREKIWREHPEMIKGIVEEE